jgi:Na+/melibiose symporter-like transporter
MISSYTWKKDNLRMGTWKRFRRTTPVAVCVVVTWNLCELAIRAGPSWSFVVAAIVEGIIEGVLLSLCFALLERMQYRERWWKPNRKPSEDKEREEREEKRTDPSQPIF